jgi:hypothetical protein
MFSVQSTIGRKCILGKRLEENEQLVVEFNLSNESKPQLTVDHASGIAR